MDMLIFQIYVNNVVHLVNIAKHHRHIVHPVWMCPIYQSGDRVSVLMAQHLSQLN